MQRPERPGVITLLTVLGVIQGVVVVLLGIFAVADRNDADLLREINKSETLADHQVTSDHLLTFGIIGIVLGVAAIGLSLALAQGNNVVRWIFGVVAAANGAGGLYSLVALHGEQRMAGAYTLGFSLLLLWVLFGNERVENYFEPGPAV